MKERVCPINAILRQPSCSKWSTACRIPRVKSNATCGTAGSSTGSPAARKGTPELRTASNRRGSAIPSTIFPAEGHIVKPASFSNPVARSASSMFSTGRNASRESSPTMPDQISPQNGWVNILVYPSKMISISSAPFRFS